MQPTIEITSIKTATKTGTTRATNKLYSITNQRGYFQTIDPITGEVGRVAIDVTLILDDAIEIDSTIEVSSFSKTTTGVSLSPTLTKRMLQTSTNLTDGAAFFPRWLRTNSQSSDDSELFVLMTAAIQHTSDQT